MKYSDVYQRARENYIGAGNDPRTWPLIDQCARNIFMHEAESELRQENNEGHQQNDPNKDGMDG